MLAVLRLEQFEHAGSGRAAVSCRIDRRRQQAARPPSSEGCDAKAWGVPYTHTDLELSLKEKFQGTLSTWDEDYRLCLLQRFDHTQCPHSLFGSPSFPPCVPL